MRLLENRAVLIYTCSMKVILYMAISVNGIIARENNEEDFLSHENWDTFVELAHKTGCIIWGRKTHEVVKTWEEKYQKEIKNVRKIVVSSNSNLEMEEGYERVASPDDAVKKLSEEGFKEVILSGGARLNTSFAKAGLIDEVILNVDSVIVGKGIPLFSPEDFDLKLKLLETKKLNDSLVQLHYHVLK